MTIRDKQKTALINALNDARRRAFNPPPNMTLAEWAEQRYYLSPEASALSGKFSFRAAPFQRGVFDALTDDDYERVVIMSASQILKTTALIAYIGYIIDADPAPILNVQPTIKLANAFSKERIDTMLRDTPCLHGKVIDKRFRDSGNTKLQKAFPMGALTIATSNSPSDLAARPIRYLLCDEIDRYEPNKEGDPIDLAEKRTTTFHNRKIVLVSSPTDEEVSRINAEFQRSDKRFFYVPCHECGHKQQLIWRQLNWRFEEDGVEVKDPARAYYECEACGERWNNTQRIKNIEKGEWIKTNPESPIAGFHVSALYSSFLSMEKLVRDWYAAKDDPEQHKTFINTRLAETWKTDATAVNDIQWLSRLENYKPNALPNGVLLITAGIDVQIDRLEMEVVGWGLSDESWSIEYHVIQGDPTSPAPWIELAQRLRKVYTREDGVKLQINATCIDSQGGATQDVDNFCRKYRKYNVYPIRGVTGNKPLFPKKRGRYKKGGIYYNIGVETGKERLYQQLRIDETGAGYCHFPHGYDDTYFEGLTAEKYITKYKNGRPYKTWFLKAGMRNEPLDCRVYSMAARYSLNVDMQARMEALKQKAEKLEDGQEVQQPEETPQPDKVDAFTNAQNLKKAKAEAKKNVNRRPLRSGPRKGGYISGLKNL